MKTKSNKVRHIITLTTGQYDHLYNIMCSQDEIISTSPAFFKSNEGTQLTASNTANPIRPNPLAQTFKS